MGGWQESGTQLRCLNAFSNYGEFLQPSFCLCYCSGNSKGVDHTTARVLLAAHDGLEGLALKICEASAHHLFLSILILFLLLFPLSQCVGLRIHQGQGGVLGAASRDLS